MSSSEIDFGRLAAAYDDVRPVDANWWQVFDLVVREGGLRGRRVLDAGCGTGRLAAALAERARAKVWGVDRSPEMLAVARTRVPPGVGLKLGRLEELPFKDDWFDAAVAWLVVHLVDRPRALAELRRVVRPGGAIAVVSFHPDHFAGYWLNRFFPSLAAIDLARFPTEEELAALLPGARFRRLSQAASLSREDALRRLRERHISTFDLLDEEELRAGTERAERELPATLAYRVEWLVAVADVRRSG